jgi:AraC-like DNA-binding protein
MDAFSEVLSGVKLKGAVFFTAELSAPWGFSSPKSSAIAPTLAPGAPHLIIYHFVVEGTGTARLPDGRAIDLQPGDIVMFPHGDAHQLSNGKGGREVDISAIIKKVTDRDLTPMKAGGGGVSTRFVCGYLACDPALSRPVLTGLPPMVKVNVRTDRSGQWLEQCILHLVDEAASGRPGSEAMLAKLSEALFVDTLRRFVAGLPDQQTGWLAGARDPIVGKSLAMLHGRVDHPWTIAELAAEVGLSRSALVDRFNRYLSEPPMAYLTRWRLQLAEQSLTMTPRGVAEIAADVGYESEAAFNRAFKRAFGLPPAHYRRAHKGAARRRSG